MLNLYRKIGIWGDSILKGVVFDEIKGAYKLLTAGAVESAARILNIPILNKSRFGNTIERGKGQLERSLKDGLDCDLVMLEYGGNDCDLDWAAISADPSLSHEPKTPLNLFKDTYRQMIRLLRQHGIEPLLVSLPPLHSERYFEFIVSKGLSRDNIMVYLGDVQQIYRHQESYSLAVTSLAASEKCLYAPIREAFLSVRNFPDYMCSDGIHPNEKGHELMQNVLTGLFPA